MKQYLLSAALTLAATAALAAPVQNKNAGQTTNLTGAYVGVYGGYGWINASSADVNGWDTGLFAGYKLDKVMGWSNGYVFGGNAAIEGFYGLSDAKDSGKMSYKYYSNILLLHY